MLGTLLRSVARGPLLGVVARGTPGGRVAGLVRFDAECAVGKDVSSSGTMVYVFKLDSNPLGCDIRIRLRWKMNLTSGNQTSPDYKKWYDFDVANSILPATSIPLISAPNDVFFLPMSTGCISTDLQNILPFRSRIPPHRPPPPPRSALLTIVGHSQNGDLRDGAIPALHTAGSLVDGGQIGVHVTGETTTSGHLLTGSGHLTQSLGVRGHVGEDDQHVLLALVGEELGGGERQARRDDALDGRVVGQVQEETDVLHAAVLLWGGGGRGREGGEIANLLTV